ncbi:MAG: nitroreductase [Rhodobacteraceae bacterium]|nr:nitroreductase [Paracoccaceae bacterium]
MNKELKALQDLLNNRYSCRGFLDTELPREIIEEIVTTAQKVPSWCNSQPWQLAICSPKKTKEVALDLMQSAEGGMHDPDIAFPESYRGVYKERRSTCGWQLYDAVGVAKGDRDGSYKQMMENYRFFGAPHVAIISTPKELGVYGAVDCGAFIVAFALAAQASGVATIPQAAVAGISPIVRSVLSLPEDRDILCAISFGYEDKSHPANQFRTERAPISEVIDWH